MPDQRLPVLTAADGGYIPFLATSLYSLTAHGGQSLLLEITVLYRDIGLSDRDRLETLVRAPHRLRWIEVSEALCRQIGAPLAFSGAPPNYFRLLAPYIFPGEERALYLDADTVILGDISPLATTFLEGCGIGAVVDWLSCVRDAVSNWSELGLDGDTPYFNSGVLLMDLGRWRKESIALRAFEICSQNSQHLWAQGKWLQYEQYGLNVAVRGRWHPLSAVWNHFTELPATSEAPMVLHYVAQGKPGSARCRPECTALFEQTLQHTPWSGWWPAVSRS